MNRRSFFAALGGICAGLAFWKQTPKPKSVGQFIPSHRAFWHGFEMDSGAASYPLTNLHGDNLATNERAVKQYRYFKERLTPLGRDGYFREWLGSNDMREWHAMPFGRLEPWERDRHMS